VQTTKVAQRYASRNLGPRLCAVLVQALFILALHACRGKPDPSAASAFDDLVTADALFAPSDRARVERTTSTPADGGRTYNFVLRPEPSMVPDRHFYMLTVVVARAGLGPSAQAATAAGPNGAFVERQLRTSDGAFEITLRLGSLLPESVAAPDVSLEAAGQAIADAYGKKP
jgi:hypothetical protein